MNWQRFVRKCQACLFILKGKVQPGFSQAGEDGVVHYLFQQLQIKRPSYLDIGTNHPIIGNNTYLFYMGGSKGVCVEPDPELCRLIRKYRPGSTLLQAGIGLDRQQQQAHLYIYPQPYTGWNTFSKEEAEKRELESGIKAKDVKLLPLLNINDVMETHFHGAPDFLSIDVEGLDLGILQTLEFERFAPKVICVETISFSVNNTAKKLTGLIDFIVSKNYLIYADTNINTIFCRKDLLP
jgi:FkbM family methyltransferase